MDESGGILVALRILNAIFRASCVMTVIVNTLIANFVMKKSNLVKSVSFCYKHSFGEYKAPVSER